MSNVCHTVTPRLNGVRDLGALKEKEYVDFGRDPSLRQAEEGTHCYLKSNGTTWIGIVFVCLAYTTSITIPST
jgi:hypothetical protein